eukprot:846827-Pyramimonas_sp.AAC.2
MDIHITLKRIPAQAGDQGEEGGLSAKPGQVRMTSNTGRLTKGQPGGPVGPLDQRNGVLWPSVSYDPENSKVFTVGYIVLCETVAISGCLSTRP